MTEEATFRNHLNPAREAPQPDWTRLARRANWRRGLSQAAMIGFLIVSALPILLPYLWLFTISASARTGGVESSALWRSCAVLLPAVFVYGLLRLVVKDPAWRKWGAMAVAAITVFIMAALIGPELHLNNYRFMWIQDFVGEIRGTAGTGAQFPWVWTAFGNSLLLAGVQAAMVILVSTLAGYYLSRFRFPGRSAFLLSLLGLHAFPAMTMIIPLFLMMYWVGLLDTLSGVILVIVTLELPFSIFIMKGFFDTVPWDIEMSAMADGASRRQAFYHVVLPQVRVGILAIGIFAFLKGWEEYVFVRTLLFEKSNWVMSLFLFWVADDIMGVD